jgi:hypothetical protein
MTAKLSRVLLVALAVLLGAGYAYCDTITDGNIQLTASVTGTTATVTIACLNLTQCGNDYLGDVTLKGFTFTGNPTLGSPSPSGYTIQNGGQNNDAVGAGGGCNGTQTQMAVCWDAPTTLQTQLGSPVTFTATVTDGMQNSVLHVQVTGYNNTSGSQTQGGKVFALSDDLTGGGSTSVPEPSSGMLAALSLAGLAGLSVLRKVAA